MRTTTSVAFAVMFVLVLPDRFCGQELHKLTASDAAPLDEFGQSVSLHGNTALVGAPSDDDSGDSSGSAYLFDVITGVQLSKLVASDASPYDRFGWSVAIDAGCALVGATNATSPIALSSGAAYLFDVTTGQQLKKLTAADAVTNAVFGNAVSIGGGLALVGAPQAAGVGPYSGAVYVFDLSSGQQTKKLVAGPGTIFDGFGFSVSMAGNLALVGAASFFQNGAAYVFDLVTGQLISTLVSSDVGPGDRFGYSVSIANNVALVGAPFAGAGAGAAYFFDALTGQELMKVSASDGASGGSAFGSSTALSGGLAAIGGGYLAAIPGSVYLFDVANGVEVGILKQSDGGKGFGISVSLSGGLLVGGDPLANLLGGGIGNYSGAAYAFDVDPTPFVIYGSGCAGTGGVVPQLTLTGSAVPGGAMHVGVKDGVGSGMAFILIGLQQAALPMGWGCTLNVAPLLPVFAGPIPLGPPGAQGAGAGSVSIPVSLPAAFATPVTLTLQAFVADNGVASGFANTNGVQMNVR